MAGMYAEQAGGWLHENVVEPVSTIPDTARSWYDSASELLEDLF